MPRSGRERTAGPRAVQCLRALDAPLRHAVEFPHDCPYMFGRPYRPNLDGDPNGAAKGEGFRKGEADDEGNVVE